VLGAGRPSASLQDIVGEWSMMKLTASRRARSAGSTHRVLASDEIAARAAQAAETVPPDDQQAIDRAAGEGMVPTVVEAATIPSQHITGQGQLLANDGTPVVRVTADLQVDPQVWAGQLMLAAKRVKARSAARFWLRLDDGGGGRLTVKYRDGAVYLVEGTGPFEPDIDGRLSDAFAAPMVATSRNRRNREWSG